MKYEFIEKNKSEVCEKILRALPQWFGIESAILDYIKDVEKMLMLVVKDQSNVIGFLALNRHNKHTAEIHVMGILPEFHRQKIGQQMILYAEQYLRQENFQYITVKTLSESRQNEEFDRTRKFYLSVGFLPVEEFKTLWGEHNPCLLLIKNV